MKPRNLLLLCFAFTLIGIAAPTQSPDWDALGKLWWSHIQYLADDSLEGRDTGSQGFEKAANYMAEQFRAAGLEPGGVDGYRQPMDFQVVKIDESRCSLELLQGEKVQPVKLGDDAVLGVSSHAAENVEAAARLLILFPVGDASFGISGLLRVYGQTSSVTALHVPSPPASDAIPRIPQRHPGI